MVAEDRSLVSTGATAGEEAGTTAIAADEPSIYLMHTQFTVPPAAAAQDLQTHLIVSLSLLFACFSLKFHFH